MLKLKENYPNVTKTLSNEWIKRFEKSTNPEIVERLFDYLEDKYLEESKKLDPLNEDLYVEVSVYSRNWKNFVQVYLEKVYYNADYDSWESCREFPVAIELEIGEYYINNDEERTQEKLEDFLRNLPKDLDQVLI